MKIPEIREELLSIASATGNPRLAHLASQLNRRSATRKAPASSNPMTPAIAASIRAMAKAHPRMSQAEIGRHFNVNSGRVSEVLRGKRK